MHSGRPPAFVLCELRRGSLHLTLRFKRRLELNRRGQACEFLTGTGTSGRVKLIRKRTESGVRPSANKRDHLRRLAECRGLAPHPRFQERTR